MKNLMELAKPELERRIALVGRAAERFPELREAIFMECSRLERVLAKKRAAKKPARTNRGCCTKTRAQDLIF